MESIHEVLRAGAVRSVFQPIVDLDTGAVVAYEALARGPQGPLERPDVLFSAARTAGCLAELDEACRVAAFRGGRDQGLLAPLALFVNVEPEVLDSAPLEDLLEIAAGVDGALRVVLEITERALAARPAELLRTVERVRELGWGVALDDVGAEALSLAFMPLLRPDVVKLDLTLVQQRPGPAVAQIMNAVNAYAERSGALVLAEGIENAEHLAVARALGARLGQGWLFGRPVPHALPGPVGELVLPPAPQVAGEHASVSPFSCLPPDPALRRAPKSLLIELSKQLEREAMRLGRPASSRRPSRSGGTSPPPPRSATATSSSAPASCARWGRGCRWSRSRGCAGRPWPPATRCGTSGTWWCSARTSRQPCSRATWGTRAPTWTGSSSSR